MMWASSQLITQILRSALEYKICLPADTTITEMVRHMEDHIPMAATGEFAPATAMQMELLYEIAHLGDVCIMQSLLAATNDDILLEVANRQLRLTVEDGKQCVKYIHRMVQAS